MSNEAKITALLLEGPKNSHNLAINSGLSPSVVRNTLKKMRDATPKRAYVSGWGFYSPCWAAIYSSGDQPDVPFEPYSESNMALETSIRTQVLKALAEKPMMTTDIADKIGCSPKTVGTYIKLLRAAPARIRIVRYNPPAAAGRWIPVYGRITNHVTKDAPEPTKAETKAYWRSLEAVEAPPQVAKVFPQQSWFSALEAA